MTIVLYDRKITEVNNENITFEPSQVQLPMLMQALRGGLKITLSVHDSRRRRVQETQAFVMSIAPQFDGQASATVRCTGPGSNNAVLVKHLGNVAGDMPKLTLNITRPWPWWMNPEDAAYLGAAVEEVKMRVIEGEPMTPDSHQFYVGSPNTHTKHRWAKKTLADAIAHAEERARETMQDQFVVQVVRVIEAKTTVRVPRKVKKEVKRGKKA